MIIAPDLFIFFFKCVFVKEGIVTNHVECDLENYLPIVKQNFCSEDSRVLLEGGVAL